MSQSSRSTIAVIGAGVMGTGIAAHLAGAGYKTKLFDIVPDGTKDRNIVAKTAIQKALKSKPAPFFTPAFASAIECLNTEDNLAELAECGFIIEAIVERLDIKKKLFDKIIPHISEDAILASNTSGLSIAAMSESLPNSLQARFGVLHFFNPVRYMNLIEVSGSTNTSQETLSALEELASRLGKSVVHAKDTPNFIANRIGIHSMMVCLHKMQEFKLGIDEIDALVGTVMARSKSAAFQTVDIVGLDTFAHVANNCHESLIDDPSREVFKLPELINQMISQGALGRKSGAGFFKKEGKAILVLDPSTQSYRPQVPSESTALAAALKEKTPSARLQALVSGEEAASQFAWQCLSSNLVYAATLLGDIADDIISIDQAMRWGFNWELGPFEAWDALGLKESCARMLADGLPVPAWVQSLAASSTPHFYQGSPLATSMATAQGSYQPIARDAKDIQLSILKTEGKLVEGNDAVSMIDIGDGVLCLEVHTKLNTLDEAVIAGISRAVDIAEKDFSALIIGNNAAHFCAGANLKMILGAAEQKNWTELDAIILRLQTALQKLRYSSIPTVSAPSGFALGGGAELQMATDAAIAHAETYTGLVEVGVGLIPAGCGCLRLLERYTGDLAQVDHVDVTSYVAQASLQIAMAKVSTSADDAKTMRYLRATDGVSLNRSHQLAHAKQRALGLSAGYRRPMPAVIKAAGADVAATIRGRVASMVEGGFASPDDALMM